MYQSCNAFVYNVQNRSDPRVHSRQWNMNKGRNYGDDRFCRDQQILQTHYGATFANQTYNNEYWCETCDRGFRTKLILENHKKQHQKCNIDGCQFIAHPKVITKHIQMQHSTGLYKKIAKLNNPEEIKKWREERKRKYPTKSNIEKKNSEIQEKLHRGEKMSMGSMKKKRETHVMKRNRPDEYIKSRVEHKAVKRKVLIKSAENQMPPKLIRFETDTAQTRSLKPFAGVQYLIDECDNQKDSLSPESYKDLIEDDEVDVKQETVEAKPVICGALVSLINDYGSSDEEECSNIELNTKNAICTDLIKQQIITKDQIKNTITNNENTDDDSGPEEVKVVKGIEADISDKDITEINKKKQKNNKPQIKRKPHENKGMKNFRRKLPSTLLEKLLNNEIRKERNIVLQCIRYIINNNYFDNDTT